STLRSSTITFDSMWTILRFTWAMNDFSRRSPGPDRRKVHHASVHGRESNLGFFGVFLNLSDLRPRAGSPVEFPLLPSAGNRGAGHPLPNAVTVPDEIV
ncbi:MAG: hypothetical protein ACE5GH_05575, partial [Fidelibacterota bacterium]